MYRPFSNTVAGASSFSDVLSTIGGLTQDFCTAFNTGNYDHAAAMFAADGQFMPPNRESVTGPKAIERSMRELAEAGIQELHLETVRIEHSADLAVEVGRYTLALRRENGTTVVDRGKYIHTWRRLGVWLMLADCWNSNLPVLK